MRARCGPCAYISMAGPRAHNMRARMCVSLGATGTACSAGNFAPMAYCITNLYSVSYARACIGIARALGYNYAHDFTLWVRPGQQENGGSRCETNGSCRILMESEFYARQIILWRDSHEDLCLHFDSWTSNRRDIGGTDRRKKSPSDKSNPHCACAPRVKN